MNLTHDAMLVSLRITAWSGRLYDRQASNHVAAHHDAAASAGRYNKRLLPKSAFAALTATVSEARAQHYANSLPWDDQGSRLLTVANYEAYTEPMDGLRERMVTDAAARDYSWSVPNRRFIDSGLYLPSIRSEGMGTLAVIIDTSGSVDSDALAAFWSEVREVAAEIEPERIVVLQVDAAVQDEQEYAPGELPERIVVKGRWGTDFRPGFARLAEQGIRPAVCLYFTDMDCDRYPESEPNFSVVWVDWSTGPGSSMQPPPWGEHVRING